MNSDMQAGYEMALALAEAEIERLQIALRAVAEKPACGCREGECESKPAGCRMAVEVAQRDPAAM